MRGACLESGAGFHWATSGNPKRRRRSTTGIALPAMLTTPAHTRAAVGRRVMRAISRIPRARLTPMAHNSSPGGRQAGRFR